MESLGLVHSPSLDHPSLDAIEHTKEASESSSYSNEGAQCQEYGNSDLLNVEDYFQFQNSAFSIKTKHNSHFSQDVSTPSDQNFSLETTFQQTQCNGLQCDSYLFEISNPISDSPQYRAYRARQNDRDIRDEKKWPPDLEIYFLDAMMDVPHMGRHKFTFDGKPHGRNELIALYIWISYKENLPPDVTPDPLMNRHRKQISSHIQVLKKFMRGHCAFDEMFPPAGTVPENGYSFDKNSCLIALSQGRLPGKAYRDQVRYDLNRRINQREAIIRALPYFVSSLRPFFFSPAPTSPITSQPSHFQNHICDEKLDHGIEIAHLCNDTLESVPQWQEKFPPLLNMLRSSFNEIDCEIIHMQVSLDSLFNFFPSSPMDDSVNLKCGFIVANKMNFESESPTNTDPCYWRSVTVLTEPREYYGDPSFSSDTDNNFSSIVVEDNRIFISIPVRQWAAKILSSQRQLPSSCIFSGDGLYCSHHGIKHDRDSSDISKTGNDKLSSLTQHSRNNHHFSLSMYQELFYTFTTDSGSTSSKRRAIILWSFGYSSNSEKRNRPLFSWRYLFPLPYLSSSSLSHESRCNDSNVYIEDTTLNPAPSFNARVTTTTKNKFDSSTLEKLQNQPFNILVPYNRSTTGLMSVHSDFDYATTSLSSSSVVTIPNPQRYQEPFTGIPYHFIPSNYQNISFEPPKNSLKTSDNDNNNVNALSPHKNNFIPYTMVEKVNTGVVETNSLFPCNKVLPRSSNSDIRFFSDIEISENRNWNHINNVTTGTQWSQPIYHYNPHQDSIIVDDDYLQNNGNHDNAN
ncbi:Conidiophore development regulator abaA [Golovinomyces cichoracearum]|uniref:Conidiophore development regulator abaA n=1 Tax=Golovinomyces cichoracearum TaxID=62708 RepID=A0A420HHR9_9PEZI|nr:Conidiophore development regulator abaA [Golovinomyces cichoracearum]